MSENFLKLHGRQLLAQGYSIVPIARDQKFPKGLKRWQKEKSNIKNLDKWINMGFTGVGINARTCPGVDLDIYDEAVLRVVLQAVVNIAGDSYHRIGEFPKVLLPYRTDKPFKKIQSKTYIDSQGRRNKVEILCDGQQFVHSAGHPKTGKDYYWPPGEGLNGSDAFPLINTPLETLPTIEEEQCHMIVEAYEAAIPDDWVEESVWLKNKKKPITGETVNFVAFDEAAEIAKDKVDSWMDEWVRPAVKADTDITADDPPDDAPQDGDAFQYLKPKIDISMDQMQQTLKDIPADDYSIWIMVGMALHHQTDGDADGLAMWDEWSLKADNYSPDIINEKWDTFEAEDQAPVTFLSVLRMARELRTQEDPLGEFIDRYVYITDGDRVVDLDKSPMAKPMEMKAFKNRTANVRLTIDIAAPTIKDPTRTKPKDMPVHGLWLVNPLRKSAEGICYHPGKGRLVPTGFGDDVEVNCFYMKEHVEGHGADLKPFFDHIKYLFGEHSDWFIDWMAFSLQKPEIRCKVTPLHISVDEGTGRGWMTELLYALVGHWNCSKTRMATISADGGYNEYMVKSLFCFIEEVHEGDKRFAISDKVRDMLTEKYFEVNVKYDMKGTIEVFVNFMWNSNHTDALVLKEKDRRIAVFRCDEAFKGKEYYAALYEWTDDARNVGRLFHWLKERDISGFDWTRAPMTEAKKSMIGFNKTLVEEAFHDFLEDHPEIEYVTTDLLIEMLNKGRDFGNEFGRKEEKQLVKLIQQMGGVNGRHRIDGAQSRFWVLKSSQNGSGPVNLKDEELSQAGLKMLQKLITQEKKPGGEISVTPVTPVTPDLDDNWMD